MTDLEAEGWRRDEYQGRVFYNTADFYLAMKEFPSRVLDHLSVFTPTIRFTNFCVTPGSPIVTATARKGARGKSRELVFFRLTFRGISPISAALYHKVVGATKTDIFNWDVRTSDYNLEPRYEMIMSSWQRMTLGSDEE